MLNVSCQWSVVKKMMIFAWFQMLEVSCRRSLILRNLCSGGVYPRPDLGAYLRQALVRFMCGQNRVNPLRRG